MAAWTRKKWSEAEIEIVKSAFPNTCTPALAEKIGCSQNQLKEIARKLGLRKSPEHLASPQAKGFKWRSGTNPNHVRPIGSERLDSTGYLVRKVSETGNPKVDWALVHVIVWELEHGPVPPDHLVIFIDRNRANITLENLEAVTRRQLLQRNSFHRYPSELKELMKLQAKLARRLDEQH